MDGGARKRPRSSTACQGGSPTRKPECIHGRIERLVAVCRIVRAPARRGLGCMREPNEEIADHRSVDRAACRQASSDRRPAQGGWTTLRDRLVDDLEARGQVLPQQLKVALGGLRALHRLTPAAHRFKQAFWLRTAASSVWVSMVSASSAADISVTWSRHSAARCCSLSITVLRSLAVCIRRASHEAAGTPGSCCCSVGEAGRLSK